MSSSDVFLSRLISKRTGPGRWICKCPSHEDRTASLSVRELDDGRLLIHCFAGCNPNDVLSAVGLTMHDLFPERLIGASGKPEKRPFPATDVLQAIAFEAQIVAIVAIDLTKTHAVSNEIKDRLTLAAARIQAGLTAAGVNHG
jgi:hypothetical protein